KPQVQQVQTDEINLSDTVKPSTDEDYYFKQIVELNSELKNNPDDLQTKFKLAVFYAKAKMFDNAQNIASELDSTDRDLAKELRNEIEQIKRKEKASIKSNESLITATQAPETAIQKEILIKQQPEKIEEAKKKPQGFQSPYKKKKRFF
ncbi:MAG: hypothetical protein SFU25_11345, partial [Candidatus Caenarcaniphilales bacterium]|nr:hypothetical protein [Candidatus Caenarcaniphilales bacterium]